MTLDQLETISAVVEHGSFRAAAEALGRSQPALSASIKNLEDELGIQIFDRSEYRPKLTAVGAVFLNSSNAAVEAAKYAARVGTELGKNKVETSLRISCDPLAPIEALQICVEACAQPTVPVTLIVAKSILDGAHEGLLSGEVDLAIGTAPKDRKQIEKIDIAEVTLVGAISKKLLGGKTKATEKILNSHAHVFFYDKEAVFDGGGLKIFVPDHATKLRMIEGGLAWGRISRAEFEAADDLALIDKNICEHLNLEICIMRPKNRPIGPVARAIWDEFKKR